MRRLAMTILIFGLFFVTLLAKNSFAGVKCYSLKTGSPGPDWIPDRNFIKADVLPPDPANPSYKPIIYLP